MNTLFGVSVCILGIFIFVLHSYFKRGVKLTFNFFFFAFLVAIIKEGPMRINGVLMKNPTMPYEFLRKDTPVVIDTLLGIMGWVFTFYLGWYIAERVVERLDSWRERIFPTVFLSGLVTAGIGYSVEATAIGINWWRWTIQDARLTGSLAGVPFIVFETWMHFPTQYLILPYMLIEYSRFKKADWKGVFFLIPFIHSISTHCQPEFLRAIVEYIALTALLILAFFSPLRFDYSGIKVPSPRRFLKKELLELLPMLVIFIFLFILAFLDIAKIHNARLLISLLPISFLIMLAIKRMPLLWIITLAIICLAFFNKQAVPAAIPVISIVVFKALAKIKAKPTT